MTSSRVLIPVYEDWVAVTRVIQELDASGHRFDILLVDDGSVTPCSAAPAGIAGAGTIEVLFGDGRLFHRFLADEPEPAAEQDPSEPSAGPTETMLAEEHHD